jgi:hypothetical protein
MNDWSGTLGVVSAIGGFVLLAAIIWVWLQNRRAGNVDQAERGARRLREQLNAEDTGQAPRSDR